MGKDGFNSDEAIVIAKSLALIRNILGIGSRGELIDLLMRIGFPINEGVQRLVTRSFTEKVTYDYLRRFIYRLPELTDPSKRRILAFYPTSEDGFRVMMKLLSGVDAPRRPVVADPFMGPGSLLVPYVEDNQSVDLVWGTEMNPTAALLGYALLLHNIPDIDRVIVRITDSFREFLQSDTEVLTADIILSNPPFTRWEALPREYREALRELVMGKYGNLITRFQLNLSILGVFVLDSVLKNGGIFVSVLPASLFYTLSGKPVRELLLSRYELLGIARGAPSFSEGSGFVELIILARKGQVTDHYVIRIIEPGRVGELVLGREFLMRMNWLGVFGDAEFLGKIVEYRDKGVLVMLRELIGKDGIVRGVEMYGPDFFLIPNKYWLIISERDDHVVIKSRADGAELEIPKVFLVKALRRPGLYRCSIVEPHHYFLAIPPQAMLPIDVKRYIEYGVRLGTAKPALKFGKHWYSHVYKQLKTKKPFGRLFLPDKVVPEGFRAYMTAEPVTATKNFYIIKTNNEALMSMLHIWFNSSMFKRLFKITSRYISERWTRYVKEDYLNTLVPKTPEELNRLIGFTSTHN